jgi:hypothetical protein
MYGSLRFGVGIYDSVTLTVPGFESNEKQSRDGDHVLATENRIVPRERHIAVWTRGTNCHRHDGSGVMTTKLFFLYFLKGLPFFSNEGSPSSLFKTITNAQCEKRQLRRNGFMPLCCLVSCCSCKRESMSNFYEPSCSVNGTRTPSQLDSHITVSLMRALELQRKY